MFSTEVMTSRLARREAGQSFGLQELTVFSIALHPLRPLERGFMAAVPEPPSVARLLLGAMSAIGLAHRARRRYNGSKS